MTDELDEITTEEKEDVELDGVEKDMVDEIDPSKIIAEDIDDPIEEVEGAEVVSPEDDPFGFGAFGETDEDGEYRAPTTDEDDEREEDVSEDIFS